MKLYNGATATIIAVAFFLAIAEAVPINITTYNYVSYDVSGYYYLTSKSSSSFAKHNQIFNKHNNQQFFPTYHGDNYHDDTGASIKSSSLILLSDSKTTKLNHDYNNVLYCFIKYLRKLGVQNNNRGLLNLDKDLINFVKINKSTDNFLQKVISRKDIKKLLSNFKHANGIEFAGSDYIYDTEKLLALLLRNSSEEEADGDTFLQHEPAYNIENNYDFGYIENRYDNNSALNINLVHLYHLIPNIEDTFQYQVFHGLKFKYPDLDESFTNSFRFLQPLLDMINELTNFDDKEVHISFSAKKSSHNGQTTLSNVRYLAVGRGNDDSMLSFQVNLLIVVNLGFLGLKLMEIVTGNDHGLLSMRWLVYFI